MAHASQSTPKSAPAREFNPQAAVFAWLWPGLGHISIGQRHRGYAIMFGVLFLVAVGVLVGGIDAVDRREDRLWFYAQSLCGPLAFGLDFLNQNVVKNLPDEQLNHATGLARINEMGTLFVALAGLMNLVVILDALHFSPRPDKPLTPEHARRKYDRRETDQRSSSQRESEA